MSSLFFEKPLKDIARATQAEHKKLNLWASRKEFNNKLDNDLNKDMIRNELQEIYKYSGKG